MAVEINTIAVGSQNTNCYLVASGEYAWLIDPGDEYELITSYLNLDKYKLKGIINTHAHFDHIGAVTEIKEKYNIPFFLHSKDKRLLSQANLMKRMVGDVKTLRTPVIDGYLDDMIYFDLNKEKILIHPVPGHTNGSVSFEIAGNLFIGDLFFENTIGRTDLPGGNKELLVESVNFIFKNYIGFRIFPGHGKSFILDNNLIKKININGFSN